MEEFGMLDPNGDKFLVSQQLLRKYFQPEEFPSHEDKGSNKVLLKTQCSTAQTFFFFLFGQECQKFKKLAK